MIPLRATRSVRRLVVDLADLELAFRDASPACAWFLDVETGKVTMLTADAIAHVRHPAPDEPGGSDPEIPLARRILAAEGTRYLRIPYGTARPGYEDAVAFLTTLDDPLLEERLWHALHGANGMRLRRFRQVVDAHAPSRDRWRAFVRERVRERVHAWLRSHGVVAFSSVSGDRPARAAGLG